MKKKKIGIMGGTFDPIHLGHLIIAQSALKSLKLDKIWFMPAGDPPHKGLDVTPKQIRLELVRLAIEGNESFELFTYETDKERPSYSAITFTELDEIYPDIEFYFIMGADSILYFDKWYEPQTICEHAKLVVANRNNVPNEDLLRVKKDLEAKFNADIFLVDTPQIDISSSHIRNQIKAKDIESIRYLIPEKVYNYFVVQNK